MSEFDNIIAPKLEVTNTDIDSNIAIIYGVLTRDYVSTIVSKGHDFINNSDNNKNLIIDLGYLKECDSSGVALLVYWHGIAKQHKKTITYRGMSDKIKALIEVSDLSDIINLK